MSEKDINRWRDTITPRDKAPQPWTIKSGGSWDMLEVQPIPDSMLAELAERYYYAGTPWNCRSMPLSASDREYMYLLYYSMQGLVARMRQAEKKEAESAAELDRLRAEVEALRADAAVERSSRRMFVLRLEGISASGDRWITVQSVFALLNDCDFLAARERDHAAIAKAEGGSNG